MAEQTGRHGKGHRRDSDRKMVRYTVWNNDTDQLIALDASGPDCAEAMGMTYASFLSIVSRGKSQKWTIEKAFADEMEEWDG